MSTIEKAMEELYYRVGLRKIEDAIQDASGDDMSPLEDLKYEDFFFAHRGRTERKRPESGSKSLGRVLNFEGVTDTPEKDANHRSDREYKGIDRALFGPDEEDPSRDASPDRSREHTDLEEVSMELTDNESGDRKSQSEHDDVDEDSANDTPLEWKDAVAFFSAPDEDVESAVRNETSNREPSEHTPSGTRKKAMPPLDDSLLKKYPHLKPRNFR